MKTAYELAMERLSKSMPSVKLTDAQKRQIADLESRYKAKVAEREIALKEEMTKAAETGDADKLVEVEQRLVRERKKLQAELEEKKDAVRRGQA